MQVLITGASGFAGRHLIRQIVAQHTTSDETIQITGTTYGKHNAALASDIADMPVTFVPVDLTDDAATIALLEQTKPDVIYHLAAQSSPSRARQNPWRTLEGNIRIQFNVLEACVTLGQKPRILIVSSGDIYCGGVQPGDSPLVETMPFRPSSSYSVSKVTQDLMGLQYYLAHNLPLVRARPFNHIGQGQSLSFVATDFAMQIARIEKGQQAPVIEVGNLAAKRDFTDVRDVVRAYTLLIEKGIVGEAYNIASGKAFSIDDMLQTLLSFTDTAIDVRVDPDKLRPIDVPLIIGDYSKLHALTGWQPQIAFEDSLRDVLDDCRQRVTHRQEQ